MASIPEKRITDCGVSIPLIGMGMATAAVGDDVVKQGVIEAIKAGYRHFDTAALYGTEKSLGEAVTEALRLGLINSRAELFITTKLWCNSTERHLVLPAINQSLRPIPVIGMGTATLIDGIDDEVKAAVIEAIKVGYRHFDTAALYQTEKSLGEGITEALNLGLIKSRAEVFVTTKLWCNSAERRLVLPALKESLRNLGLEYVDLYLVHWPVKINYNQMKIPVPKETVSAIDIKAVWEAMEECQNLGLTKSIGVSNFSSQKIQEILSFAKIPPAVNQVEMNPLWQQKQLNEFCKKNNILLTAYSPLGAVGSSWGNNSVIECGVLQDIAKSKGKTTAQISLRWLYEQGVSFIVKSFNSERMKQNLDIFDWSLTQEELNKITEIPQRKLIYLHGVVVTEPNEVTIEIDGEI